METLSFKAPEELNQRLERLAEKRERSKGYLIRKAIEQFLEDQEDYEDATMRIARDKPENRIGFSEVKRKYGLED